MGEAPDAWGRVAEDGTVYVRTADGERQVGSWAAGSPDEALAYYQRKFDGLKVEMDLLENRLQARPWAPPRTPEQDRQAARAGLRRRTRSATWTACAPGWTASARSPSSAAPSSGRPARSSRPRPRGAQGGARRRGRAAARRPASGRPPASGCARWWTSGRRVPRLDRKTDDELWHRLSPGPLGVRQAPQAALRRAGRRARARSARKRSGWSPRRRRLQDSTDWNPTAGASAT